MGRQGKFSIWWNFLTMFPQWDPGKAPEQGFPGNPFGISWDRPRLSLGPLPVFPGLSDSVGARLEF